MTEAEWLACGDARLMLEALNQLKPLDDRKFRLFCCACCRRLWHLLTDPRSRRAIEVAESFADGQVALGDIDAVWGPAYEAQQELQYRSERGAYDDPEADPTDGNWEPHARAAHAAYCAVQVDRSSHSFANNTPSLALQCVASHAWLAGSSGILALEAQGQRAAEIARSAESRAQAHLLRCIASPPLCLPQFRETLGASAAVLALAHAAYDERHLPNGHLDPDRLAVLADALEDAGATGDTLAHLRSPGPHVRGCWALDLVLGRE